MGVTVLAFGGKERQHLYTSCIVEDDKKNHYTCILQFVG